MTDLYQIAINHNMTGSLQTVSPQPKMSGISAGRRTEGGDGLIYQDGFRHCAWKFGFHTKSQFAAFLAQAGLGEGTPSAFVTVRQPRNQDRVFTNYNATIIMPDFPDQARFEFTVYQELTFELIKVKEV